MQELDESDFKYRIQQKKPFILVFKANWSGSGDLMVTTIERISLRFKIRYDFFMVDIEKSPTLARHFGIKAIPTTFLFKNQEIVDYFEGVIGGMQFAAKLNKYLN